MEPSGREYVSDVSFSNTLWLEIGSDRESDPTTRIVREQAIKLSRVWKDFRTSLPKDEQEQLEKKKPSVEGLVAMVNTVASEWQGQRTASRSGRFMNSFIGFCGTLKAHSTLLEILPEGNEYISLFTGSLKTIINVRSITKACLKFLYVITARRQVPITKRCPPGWLRLSRR
jgi:hypothetical protein